MKKPEQVMRHPLLLRPLSHICTHQSPCFTIIGLSERKKRPEGSGHASRNSLNYSMFLNSSNRSLHVCEERDPRFKSTRSVCWFCRYNPLSAYSPVSGDITCISRFNLYRQIICLRITDNCIGRYGKSLYCSPSTMAVCLGIGKGLKQRIGKLKNKQW